VDRPCKVLLFETRLRKCLSRVRNIDELLDAALARFAIVKISDIETNPREREQLLLERKRLLLQLSSLTDVPCVKTFNANVRVTL